MKSHIDEAFSRRFQSIIHFPMPDYAQRLRLWEDNFKFKPFRLADDVDLQALARDHELSGGNIINVLRYVCLKAVARHSDTIRAEDIQQGIRNERHKEGKFQA
jgi:AAA+ superfamily predicted ATPase